MMKTKQPEQMHDAGPTLGARGWRVEILVRILAALLAAAAVTVLIAILESCDKK